MKQSIGIIIVLLALVSNIHSATQLISFKEGKLGVNFGGYHAGVGLGGALGGGTAGGLFAEAGTPHGQAAKAGLGGVVDGNGKTAGGLYAGATAGGNVRASTGLAGGVASDTAAGSGYAAAQAGPHYAASGLGGESTVEGSSGFSFSGKKSYGITSGVVEEHAVQPIVEQVEFKPVEQIHTEVKAEADNYVPRAPAVVKTVTKTKTKTKVEVPSYTVKEVYVQPEPVLVEKHIIHKHKPHHHHLHKTAYIGGYIGADAGSFIPPPPPPPPAQVFYQSAPVAEKRIDVGVESSANVGAGANAYGNGGSEVSYTKEVTYQRNPNFFADIFNIPISTLKAVGNFLGNTAGSTSVSVQKSASVQAGGYGYAH